MKISLKKICNGVVWVLTVILFASFVIFTTEVWGRYIYLGCSGLIFLFHIIGNGGKFVFRLEAYHGFMAVFCVFAAISSLWAYSLTDAISKAVTLALLLITSSLVYIHYSSEDNISSLIKALKWSGFMVSIYCLLFYGLDNIMSAASDIRLNNEFSNVNTIGMFIAISCVVVFFELLYKKLNPLELVFLIPSVAIISATQSRKAFVILVLGCLGIVILKNLYDKNILKAIFKVIISILAFAVALYYVLKMPMFSGVMERMEGFLNSFAGIGSIDNSTRVRNEMVKIGWQSFLQNPIGGIGIGNPHILAAQYLSFDAYLHNNYIEILCGGGIVGFVLYYSRYVYLLWNAIKHRAIKDPYFVFGIVLTVLLLVMDWGSVSYYDKITYHYIMILFININNLRKETAR